MPPSSSSDEDSDESPRSSVRSLVSSSSFEIEEEEEEEEEEDARGWSRCISVAGGLPASIIQIWCFRWANKALTKGAIVVMNELPLIKRVTMSE